MGLSGVPSLTLDVMLVVLEVWQAILVKKLDLDSSWVKQSMSEGARNLLKVCLPCPFMFILLVFCPVSFSAVNMLA